MPIEVLLYAPVSLAIALCMGAFAEADARAALKRGLKTWAMLLIGGAGFALFVAVAQFPELLLG